MRETAITEVCGHCLWEYQDRRREHVACRTGGSWLYETPFAGIWGHARGTCPEHERFLREIAEYRD